MKNIGYADTKNKKGSSTPLFADAMMFNTSYTKVDPPDYEKDVNSAMSAGQGIGDALGSANSSDGGGISSGSSGGGPTAAPAYGA